MTVIYSELTVPPRVSACFSLEAAELQKRRTGDNQIDRTAKMASVAPFTRRQWASQSLRVTAKEMSIVTARGKNNAIAERFSKRISEYKTKVVEPLPSTLVSGNLSVLKKRWEQQQQQPSSPRVQPQAAACSPADPQAHISRSAGPKVRHTSPIKTQPDTLRALQDQDTEPETQAGESYFNQLQSARPDDLTDMEAKPGRDSAEREGAAAEVPECEKPSVPLNSLKMMFEKGENLRDKHKASIYDRKRA
eukprot:superscaffoldBa00006143_g21189